MDRCNTCLECPGRSFKAQGLSWTLIEAQRYLVEIGLRAAGQVGFFGEVLSQQPVGIFVGASLPGALRITEEDLHIGGHGKALVFGHLAASVPGQRTPERRREFANVAAQRGDDRRCVFAGHFDQHGKTRMSFHQRGDVTAPGACEQITLPMTGNGAVFNLCRPFPDRDGIDDLTSGLAVSPRVQGAAYQPLGPQVLNQFFFQHSPCLDE
jgi:hypothetical protein